MSKKEVLKVLSFGKRIAEEETDDLAAYFVKTSQYQGIIDGEVDVIYGAKGSGKSAIYYSLLKAKDELFDKGILIVSGENPRGTPAFKDLVADPPASEEEFRGLWKLYLLSLIGSVFRDFGIGNKYAKELLTYLEDAKLLPATFNLQSLIRRSLDYIRLLLRPESLEYGIEIDPLTGLPKGLSGKISLREPSGIGRANGIQSIDDLFSLANTALENSDYKVWILLDRLDVAFAETADLERNALRALFKVYLDLNLYSSIHCKIFLRNDIWERITTSGFREGSHITKHVTIKWNEQSLLNLIIRRLIAKEAVRSYYEVTETEVLDRYEAQEELFYHVFPEKIDPGKRKAKTFNWMLSRTCDASSEAAPRELIHLLTSLKEVQLGRYDIGGEEPSGTHLFDRSCFKQAMAEVSKVRLEQTLYTEYPDRKADIQKLSGEKTEHSVDTLAEIWRVDISQATEVAHKLVEIGFFELLGTKEQPRFKVPFLYRYSLKMVQGQADRDELDENEEEEKLTD